MSQESENVNEPRSAASASPTASIDELVRQRIGDFRQHALAQENHVEALLGLNTADLSELAQSIKQRIDWTPEEGTPTRSQLADQQAGQKCLLQIYRQVERNLRLQFDVERDHQNQHAR